MTHLLSELIEEKPTTFERALEVWKQLALMRAELCITMEKSALEAEQKAKLRYGPEDKHSSSFAAAAAALPYRLDRDIMQIHESVAYHRMVHLRQLESLPPWKMPEPETG